LEQQHSEALLLQSLSTILRVGVPPRKKKRKTELKKEMGLA
jgi:hypothetical protein